MVSAQALQQRNTARQQRLRLDALRHAREQHRQHAAWCEGSIQGAARSKDLAHTILKAQLQSLQHALQALKVTFSDWLPLQHATACSACWVLAL